MRDLIAQIETRKRQGSIETMGRLAGALGVPIDAVVEACLRSGAQQRSRSGRNPKTERPPEGGLSFETYGLAAVPVPSQARTSAEAGILVTAAVARG